MRYDRHSLSAAGVLVLASLFAGSTPAQDWRFPPSPRVDDPFFGTSVTVLEYALDRLDRQLGQRARGYAYLEDHGEITIARGETESGGVKSDLDDAGRLWAYIAIPVTRMGDWRKVCERELTLVVTSFFARPQDRAYLHSGTLEKTFGILASTRAQEVAEKAPLFYRQVRWIFTFSLYNVAAQRHGRLISTHSCIFDGATGSVVFREQRLPDSSPPTQDRRGEH